MSKDVKLSDYDPIARPEDYKRVWYVKCHEKRRNLRPVTTRKSFTGTAADLVAYLNTLALGSTIYNSIEVVGFVPDITERMLVETARREDLMSLEKQATIGFHAED